MQIKSHVKKGKTLGGKKKDTFVNRRCGYSMINQRSGLAFSANKCLELLEHNSPS